MSEVMQMATGVGNSATELKRRARKEGTTQLKGLHWACGKSGLYSTSFPSQRCWRANPLPGHGSFLVPEHIVLSRPWQRNEMQSVSQNNTKTGSEQFTEFLISLLFFILLSLSHRTPQEAQDGLPSNPGFNSNL